MFSVSNQSARHFSFHVNKKISSCSNLKIKSNQSIFLLKTLLFLATCLRVSAKLGRNEINSTVFTQHHGIPNGYNSLCEKIEKENLSCEEGYLTNKTDSQVVTRYASGPQYGYSFFGSCDDYDYCDPSYGCADINQFADLIAQQLEISSNGSLTYEYSQESYCDPPPPQPPQHSGRQIMSIESVLKMIRMIGAKKVGLANNLSGASAASDKAPGVYDYTMERKSRPTISMQIVTNVTEKQLKYYRSVHENCLKKHQHNAPKSCRFLFFSEFCVLTLSLSMMFLILMGFGLALSVTCQIFGNICHSIRANLYSIYYKIVAYLRSRERDPEHIPLRQVAMGARDRQ